MNDWEAGTSGAVTEDFDVFVSHCGIDVKATFVAHLEDALRCAGFRPCLDARGLMKRSPALRSIEQAVAMANVHVAVVSKRYAESKRCLDELVAMMRSGKPVVPVFYDVEPGELRWVENGPFAEAFAKHSSNSRRTEQRVREWRDALKALAELTGFRMADYQRDEARLDLEVVEAVARLTTSNEALEVEQFKVGLEGPTRKCIEALESMGDGTGMLGLVGMGGVGKTTLAKEIYNHFVAQDKFKSMTFLEIHRDSSSSDVQIRPTWSRKLRKQLLWDLLRVDGSTSYDYRSRFKKVAALGPVLIVVDDVHKLGQFEALIPLVTELHPGSRIVITSRDRSVLNNVAGRSRLEHYLFEVVTLDSDASNMLFNWHAFHVKEAPEDFRDLARDVVKACGGLPLALKVVGSSLFDKGLVGDKGTIWLEAIQALKQSKDVMGVLQWSYDNLSELERRMFVDIACLFSVEEVKEAIAYWESCKYCTSCGGVLTLHTSLRNLVNKNLIEQKTLYFKVHDLLRVFGEETGRKARSHLVGGRIAEAMVRKHQGTEETLALNLIGSRKRKFESANFASMPNLHFLVLPDGCGMDGDFICMLRELRCLRWRKMPFHHIPMGLKTSHLISLDFSGSTNLASLWTESNENLKGFPNMLQLNLSECTSITKLPDSIGQSSRLLDLELYGCRNLRTLPESIGQLKVLQTLHLGGCSRLKALPDTIGALSNLAFLSTYKCSPRMKIPPSIRRLSNLSDLSIGGTPEWQAFSDVFEEAWPSLSSLTLDSCGALESLLNYGALKSLKALDINSKTLTELPESFGLLKRLTRLTIFCESLQRLPNSIGDLDVLHDLYLNGCDSLKRLPRTFGALTSLEYLTIECCPIRKLPKSFGGLLGLKSCKISGCKDLQKLPASIRELKSLRRLEVRDCGSIEAMGALTTLQGLPIWGSTSITSLPVTLGIALDLIVHDRNDPPWNFFQLFVGTSQVLEEDESGFLKAHQNETSGVASCLLQRESDCSKFQGSF